VQCDIASSSTEFSSTHMTEISLCTTGYLCSSGLFTQREGLILSHQQPELHANSTNGCSYATNKYYPTVSTQNILGMPSTWTFNQSRTYKEGINVDSSGERGTIMRAYAVPIRPAPIIPNVCPFNKLPTNLHTISMLHKCSCETCKILRVSQRVKTCS
jgi:hypothetical protein